MHIAQGAGCPDSKSAPRDERAGNEVEKIDIPSCNCLQNLCNIDCYISPKQSMNPCKKRMIRHIGVDFYLLTFRLDKLRGSQKVQMIQLKRGEEGKWSTTMNTAIS